MSESSDCIVSMRVAADEYIQNDNEAEGYKEMPKNVEMGSNTRFLANPGEIARNVRECTRWQLTCHCN